MTTTTTTTTMTTILKSSGIVSTLLILLVQFVQFSSGQNRGNRQAGLFPDGSEIPAWFNDTSRLDPADLGHSFIVTRYGAKGDGITMNTAAIQKAIDKAAKKGGVVVIPEGRFLTGALFFKPGTHLYVKEGGVLLGSDSISDFPSGPSRMEGRTLEYFPAVINASGVDGFSITGKGTIDGNGLKYWQAFWKRRAENPNCTNLEVSRPRLIFIRNSDYVRIEDVTLQNSGFWTTHLYKCNKAKLMGLHITSPFKPVKAPSTDAIDLDACSDVLVDGCFMSVNDDAIALKGGKGPWADTDSTNGPNLNIIIQHCTFGLCHSAVTCGSEAIHNRNIVIRNCRMEGASKVLWLKMRGDTPQFYEYITVENISGTADRILFAQPWTQFFDLQGKDKPPVSVCENITLRHISVDCNVFADIKLSDRDFLRKFTFEDLQIKAKNGVLKRELFQGLTLKGVQVNGNIVD
jgi:hypothetical protein